MLALEELTTNNNQKNNRLTTEFSLLTKNHQLVQERRSKKRPRPIRTGASNNLTENKSKLVVEKHNALAETHTIYVVLSTSG